MQHDMNNAKADVTPAADQPVFEDLGTSSQIIQRLHNIRRNEKVIYYQGRNFAPSKDTPGYLAMELCNLGRVKLVQRRLTPPMLTSNNLASGKQTKRLCRLNGVGDFAYIAIGC